ncbi:MAG: GNAT family N-acetyltransferase [Janthinobacterium lividum]
MEIVRDDLTGPEVAALLELHLAALADHSPPGSVHALDLDRLRTPDIDFWTVRDGTALIGCGALKAIDVMHGEIKSMRTDPDHLRRGVAAALVAHIVAVARSRGYARLSLETGSGPAFDPALALYRRFGFVDGAAFGGYQSTAFNQFLHLDL